MFEGFEKTRIEAKGVSIHLVHGGAGPPLLLLHGYPQTHVEWHKMAPALAEHYTVVAPDLRGYGDSGKPAAAAGDRHADPVVARRSGGHDIGLAQPLSG